MRLVKRGLWLSAWGVWGWLGVGLHRELPRKPSPAACSLPQGRDVHNLGFIGQTNRFAVIRAMGTDHARLSVFDASDGSQVKEIPWPSTTFLLGVAPRSTDEPMFVFGTNLDNKSADSGLSVFDLGTFESRRLATTPNRFIPIGVDPVRKIGLCSDTGATHGRIVFFDLSTGTELTSREAPEGWSLNGCASVDSSHGLVTISMTKIRPDGVANPGFGMTNRLETWKLDRQLTRMSLVEVPGNEVPISVSLNGRIAFTRVGSLASFRVFDVAKEGWVIDRQAVNEPPYDRKSGGVANDPIVSPSGRAVLDGTWSSLWDIDSERLVWSKKAHEVVRAERGDSVFVVREDWSKLLPKWSAPAGVATSAFRDLDNGDLIVRTSVKELSNSCSMNGSRNLVIATDGAVHRLPFPVNWALLSLCQLILAAPLMLTWALLRLNQRRRLRRMQNVPDIG